MSKARQFISLVEADVTKEAHRVKYLPHKELSQRESDILHYAVDSYSHVLDSGSYSYKQFANEISQVYDVKEPRNKAVVDLLNKISS